MNLRALRALARGMLDDTIEPYRTATKTLDGHINAALNEVAVRAPGLFEDSITPAICHLSVTAGQAVYALDRRVRQITAARLDGRDISLAPGGAVRHERNFLVFDSAPRRDGELRLTVTRYPLEPLEMDIDEPEIPLELHQPILHWACALVLRTPDVEIEDLARAAVHEGQFAAVFGDRPTASQIASQNRRRPLTVRYGGL
ncbi:hypothetical protein [Chitiniphilus shinanonensis]|uniref:phage adaptor protein n=1 Tax=Chitiniphilus shinanonensis TaxID=553088 RepID=UPI003044FE4D